MLFLFFEKYKCIFVTNSRCWSKTMIKWTSKIHNINENLTHKMISKRKDVCLNYLGCNELKKYADNYFIYFMVRNPYERFLSVIKAHHRFENKTFLEVIKEHKNKKIPYTYINPRSRILLNGKNVEILYFDNFRENFKNICKKHNFPFEPEGVKEYNRIDVTDKDFNGKKIYDLQLSTFNFDNMPKYQYFYNQEIIDIVYSFFKDDFELFKFNKNIGNLKPRIH